METSTNRVREAGPFSEGIGPGLVYVAYRLAAWVAEHVPLSWGNRLAQWGGTLGYQLARGKRMVVAKNLARVTGTTKEIDQMVKEAFRSYALYWLETFRLGRYSRDDLAEMVSCGSLQVLDETLSHGKGMVVATAHFGFYDLGVAWMGTTGYPFVTVAEVLKPRALFEWFAQQRRVRGMEVIPARPRDEARAALFTALENGKGVALLSERDLGRRGVWVEFFGERTTFPVGPALLVARTGAPLVGGVIYQVDENRYRVDFDPIPYELSGNEDEDIANISQLIARDIERMVAKAPEQWHLFVTNWPSDEPHLPARGSR